MVAISRKAIKQKLPESSVQAAMKQICDRVVAKTITEDKFYLLQKCVEYVDSYMGDILDGLSVGENYRNMCHQSHPPLCCLMEPDHDQFLLTDGAGWSQSELSI
eukprot:TRINITY_DN11154_c0_g3_i12.p1 TRINITY_DN11154_c0_g3~~TRINITY_DN11154_c0_g3_i12.p1  ORF type:complete len:104 (-),score=13.89 TRINITY_DN11154_c0_g3_i12:35-346(-)